MFEKLLQYKHWHLFLALVGGLILFEIIIISAVYNASSTTDFKMFFILFPIVMIYFMYIIFGWQWAIIDHLKKFLPESVQLNHNRIKTFLLIPVLYILMISTLIFLATIIGPFSNINPALLALIIPIHLLSIFGIFHTMYFAAKTIKCVELQRNCTFGDFAGEFFLIWFWFIGIWIIQPKINKLLTGDLDRESDVLDDILNNEL